MENTLTAKASIQIQKPVHEVFEAIVQPEGMSKYFIEHSTGPLAMGKTVTWKFPEFEDTFPVTAKHIELDRYISFDWSGGVEGMLVEIHLQSLADGSTVVRIVEGSMNPDEEGIKQAIGQSEGWANFLACLKASLEYGINLRKGAFDFMRPE
ncbi:ATPase [Sphingobacterium sp. DK4209]|uniref:ATPase n=1 Tax=Sphingobacterium zhuxiongii TaxID=2662364 RepID=A0A5Q0QA01_9SPHI|nr:MULTISPECIES: SRPBCC domain-containing protein [unclassified Sphingobacterium]MVZ65157.1 ATPase [Sphingobacterium sp. DK4209]QGA26104.1 ATPase [Sphingobacterium sp. dk4302]